MSVKGIELLGKLRKPLSFVGVKTGEYVYLGGVWVNIEKVIIDQFDNDDLIKEKPPIDALKKRLSEIEDILASGREDARSEEELYLEGMGIKRALYILTRKTGAINSSLKDTRRWLDYGKRIR